MTDESKTYLLEKIENANKKQGYLLGYDCKKCLNRGYISIMLTTDMGYYEAVQDCKCMKIRKALCHIEKSGLRENIKKMTFDNFLTEKPWQAELLDFAQKYSAVINTLPRWLLLSGQSGIGKTHLCTAIVGKLLNEGSEVIYMPYRESMPELKRLIMDDGYYKKISLYQRCEYLYIDDLFKGLRKDKESADVAIMFEIIDYRARNRLITIISTERSINEIIDIDEALGGRITQMCKEYKLEIKKDITKNFRIQDLI